MPPQVVSVSLSPTHSFSKYVQPEIRLIANFGVEGDAHAGEKVRHRYLVRKNPEAPNLTQIHLLHEELFAELAAQDIPITPGQMGENITTRGIDLLTLPAGALLHLGDTAIVEVTGLRDPCALMNNLHPGLMKACIARDASGAVIRTAGIMGIVLAGGVVAPGDPITLELPPGEPRRMGPV